jgi:Zn-dependent peptidase ImmA (M78 family)
VSAESQAQAAATRFRRDHHLGLQPLGDLVALIEQATGIDVAVLDVGPDEHGLTMSDPARGAVFIAVARTSNPMRQRSTLAHELAHVLFDDWTTEGAPFTLGTRSPEEIRADAFARHLLVPVDGLRELLGPRTSAGPAVLSAVVQRFLVSPAIAAIALHQAGHIDEATKDSWLPLTTPQLATRYGWTDQYQALRQESEQRRAPQRLLARAINGYLAHVVSAQTIATLRGMGVAAVETELREAGIVPTEPLIAWADPSSLPEVTVDLSDLDDPDPPEDPQQGSDADQHDAADHDGDAAAEGFAE